MDTLVFGWKAFDPAGALEAVGPGAAVTTATRSLGCFCAGRGS